MQNAEEDKTNNKRNTGTNEQRYQYFTEMIFYRL